VFVAFAGEERGLLGSAYYADHPVISMANTVAMLNLDMVGRARGAVDISGLEVSPSMEADLKAAAQTGGEGLSIARQGPGAGRSDDFNFLSHRVPAINFFTGFHADYHRPTDDWEKIDAPVRSASPRWRWSLPRKSRNAPRALSSCIATASRTRASADASSDHP
jgi:Zn-dependent M28 family amino/carboxypeptidase